MAVAGLLLTIVPSLVYLVSDLSLELMLRWMVAGMVVWFLAATPLLGFEKKPPAGKAG